MVRTIRILVRDYEWIHITVGLLGNVCFVVGSTVFLLNNWSQASYLFVTGSTAMLIGSLGNALVKIVWRTSPHVRLEVEQKVP